MKTYVLDANALMDFLADRAGSRRVAALLTEATRVQQPLLMSVVNWGEVVYLLWKQEGQTRTDAIMARAETLPVRLEPAGKQEAYEAAALKSVYKLPYADSFAAALALREHATLVTSDPHFEKLGRQLSILWLR